MRKKMIAALLVSLGAVGPLSAQTIENPYDVSKPPAIEMPADQLAVLRAGDSRSNFLTAIIDWLSTDLAIPANYRHPRIEFVGPKRMAAIRYRALGTERPAPALGEVADEAFLRQMRDTVALYEDQSRTIFLREDWTGSSPAEISVLVHELVHHVQNLAGLKYGCGEEREKPAYAAQRKWLEFHGRNFFEEFETDLISLTIRTTCAF